MSATLSNIRRRSTNGRSDDHSGKAGSGSVGWPLLWLASGSKWRQSQPRQSPSRGQSKCAESPAAHLAVHDDQLGVEHGSLLRYPAQRRGRAICRWHGTRRRTSLGKSKSRSDFRGGSTGAERHFLPKSASLRSPGSTPIGPRRKLSSRRSGGSVFPIRLTQAAPPAPPAPSPRQRPRKRRMAGHRRKGSRATVGRAVRRRLRTKRQSRSDGRGRRCQADLGAFCSTRSTLTPVVTDLPSASNSSWTRSGDRPSDGSSSSSISGADISARPIATICCSPPLMVRTVWPIRSRRFGKGQHGLVIPLLVGPGPPGMAPSIGFSRRSARRRCRGPPAPARCPASTISCGGSRSAPGRQAIALPARRTTPAIAFEACSCPRRWRRA